MNLSSCLKFIWKVTLEESKEAATPCRPTRRSPSPHRRRVMPKRLGSPTEAPVLGAAAGGSGGGVPRQGYQRALK